MSSFCPWTWLSVCCFFLLCPMWEDWLHRIITSLYFSWCFALHINRLIVFVNFGYAERCKHYICMTVGPQGVCIWLLVIQISEWLLLCPNTLLQNQGAIKHGCLTHTKPPSIHTTIHSHHRLKPLMFYNEACVNGREELSAELFMAFRLQHFNSLTGGRAVMLNFTVKDQNKSMTNLCFLGYWLTKAFLTYGWLQPYVRTICKDTYPILCHCINFAWECLLFIQCILQNLMLINRWLP